MSEYKGQEKRSFLSITWKAVFGFLIVLAAFLVVNMAASYFITRQMHTSISSVADAYVNTLDDRLEEINDYLANLAIVDQDVSNVKYSTDSIEFIQASQNVNEKLNFYWDNAHGNFRYFVYYMNRDYFNSSNRGDLGMVEALELNQAILDCVEKDHLENSSPMRKEWHMFQVDGQWYAVNYIFYENCCACCYISADDLEESLNLIELGEKSYLVFLSEDYEPYNQKQKLEDTGFYRQGEENQKLRKEKFGYRYSVICRELEYAGFSVDLIVWNENGITAGFMMQAVIVMILLLGVVSLIGIGLYIRKQLLHPILHFFQNLGRLEENGEGQYFESSQIQELQEANELYKKILDQVRQLKIQVYETTIEQQKTQIEYMQLQIQPHFYINCMNLIYNMSCMGDEEGVQMMARHVSDYFRYIFRSNSNYVALEQELEHVENYLEICRLRYRMKLDYRIESSEGLEQVKIPPLLLHTFVENSVKYGSRPEGRSTICVKAQLLDIENRRFVVIEVTDEGQGFPEEVLDQLSKKCEIVTEHGTRVGIVNTIKRMEHIYGENFHIAFYNRQEGGAMVRMSIPAEGRADEHIDNG